MSARFAAHAARLCGLMCREMGWRPPEFWNATPSEIAAIFNDEAALDQPHMDRAMLNEMMERDAHG